MEDEVRLRVSMGGIDMDDIYRALGGFEFGVGVI